ncbi:MAG: thiamine pyrophosphate-dependent enzyme, partial [Gemmatimonadota bacterium]|nr:thiamine pyrophosphate-dependent enzyme [Gemmatimonadota bacterium]
RSKEEVESHVEEQDPITILRDRMMNAGLLTQAELEAMDADARAASEDAADFADASPLPDPSTLYDHVYAEINPHGRLFLDGRSPHG